MKEDGVMLNDNIKKYRRERGISQEELAVRLHVVRQTVSKWESGKSVPDAEMLADLAEVLEVPVSRLLGREIEADNDRELTEELALLNAQLAEKNRREKQMRRAGEKRGLILFLSFISLIAAVSFENPTAALVLSGGCILSAVIILYRNLALLSSVTTENPNIKVLRITTMVNIFALAAVISLALLTAADFISLSVREEKMFAMLFIAAFMIFAGIVSPKLPFTRHTGLRLPWTVRDEDTWNLAHKILGYISLPAAILYAACALTVSDFEAVTLIAVLLWIGIPAGISYIFFRRKFCGRL